MKSRELLRDGVVILVFIFLLLGIFVIQFAMSSFKKQETVLSLDSFTGGVIVIDRDEGPEVVINREQQPPSGEITREEELFSTENLRCWKKYGIQSDDVRVFGDLLNKVPCTLQGVTRKEVRVERANNCLNINVNNELINLLCIENHQPNLILDVPTGFGVAPVVAIARNYNSVILFLLFLLSSFFVWGRIEMSVLREKLSKRSAFNEGEFVEVKYVRPAPLYEGEQRPTMQEIEKTHKNLLAERSAREAKILEGLRLQAEEVNSYIKKFNDLARKMNDYLQVNDIQEAKRLYLALFPVYTRLFNTLDETSKSELQMVVKYLHDQIHIALKGLQIRELIEKAYQETEQHRVDRRSEPRQEIASHDALREMDALRELIEKNQLEEAKKIFGGEPVRANTKDKLLKGIARLDQSIASRAASGSVQEVKKELKTLRKLLDGRQ